MYSKDDVVISHTYKKAEIVSGSIDGLCKAVLTSYKLTPVDTSLAYNRPSLTLDKKAHELNAIYCWQQSRFYLTKNRSYDSLNFYHHRNGIFFELILNFVFIAPKGTSLRGTTSFDVLSVKVRAGVLAVGDWKNPGCSIFRVYRDMKLLDG